MGFFKKLGNSVKSLTKMVSIKNITKAVSGDIGGLASEAATRAVSGFKGNSATAKQSSSNAANIVQGAILGGVGAAAGNGLADQASGLTLAIATATIKRFFVDNWKKILGFIVVVVGGIWAYRKFGSSTPKRRRY